ncbi:hypothetical protein AVEN_223930-1 [Araneus ventricosus]|uniref:Uncharacterized protein n=1 Tax=Araneus ventricosus TaxID=182803 RepID=A0A4Y2WIW2_ARAVE|nr:hypothetical protein AVEN_79660-1 [Araneus ventricosus]GBO36425.1 hypothetical protein AVEN_154214-1 [Araneus ventricosus]GBO36543.1 hypothetical protein AVEN_223930-1 [Araneus ventricosus]
MPRAPDAPLLGPLVMEMRRCSKTSDRVAGMRGDTFCRQKRSARPRSEMEWPCDALQHSMKNRGAFFIKNNMFIGRLPQHKHVKQTHALTSQTLHH